jgi:hypothetical protein
VFGKWGLFVLAALASAAVLTSSAGAVNQGSAGPNLSTRAGVVQYLASHGIDARGIVVQRGSHNYAGPNCPGKGWTCTKATRVLQAGITNQFTCTASTGGTVNPPNECVIVQSSSGATNNATCLEKIGDPTGSQSCKIYQVNTTGANNAYVQQAIAAAASSGGAQTATQNTEIAQSATSGSNNVQVNQDLKESQSAVLGKSASINQSQDGHQTTAVSQHSDTGNNTAKVLQSLTLKESATGGVSITQNQDTNGNSPNTSAAIYQNSDEDNTDPPTSTGLNNAYVFQSNDLNASGAKTGALTQNQGNSESGLFNHTDQRSTGVSTTQVNQSEHQSLGASQYGSLSQNQIGPLWNDPNQASNPGDTFTVSQSSDQNGGPGANQLDKEQAACGSSGVCQLTEKASNDHQNVTNSCTSTPTSPCDIGVTLDTSCGTDCGPQKCSGECTSPPEGSTPPQPDICSQFPSAPGCGPVITSVGFSGSDACCPGSTPTVTVTGHGFGASAPAGSDNSATDCGPYTNNGSDYGTALNTTDTHTDGSLPWTAGMGTPPSGSCVGLRVSSWSDTSVVFDFGGTGSAYDSFAPGEWYLTNGDSFTLALEGASSTVTVSGLTPVGVIG